MFSHFFLERFPMKSILFSMLVYAVISCQVLQSGNVNGVDAIGQNQTISDGETLISSGQSFVLGFFRPAGSTNRYLGIWYKKFPQTIVWVANREIPLTDSSGVLTIGSDGSLTLLNATKSIIWSSNSSGAAQTNMIAQLLDSGNLVLGTKDDFDAKRYAWQSFDYPTDTLLPGMRHGVNLRTGQTWYLTSWKNESDPSVGEFIYKDENFDLPQIVLHQGAEKLFRTGPWNGQRFSGFPLVNNTVFEATFVDNDEEVYYTYELMNTSQLSKVTLNASGIIQRSVLNEGDWSIMYSLPYDLCSKYGKCGANGICSDNRDPICECLDGFVPKSQRDWEVFKWSSGCVRRIPLDCKKGDGFVRRRNVNLPDLVQFKLNKSMTTEECEVDCLNSCSCTAFTNSNISNGGCLMWFGDLIDIQQLVVENSEQDIYLRLAASELHNEEIELPLFEREVLSRATKNFSFSNIIGEGGFGPVYKGQLSSGVEIEVKRQSKNSGQGLAEFKN